MSLDSDTSRLKHDPYSALRVSEFRNFIFARFFLTIASLMQAVIVGWQVYELTKDPFSLGLIGLAEAIPAISVSLFAGHIVDTSPRKTVLISSYFLLLFCAISLFAISSDAIGFIAFNKVALIYSVIFVSGIARGFVMPSAFAFLAQLIPPKLFANAVTWSTSTWQLGAVTGPAIAGFVYAVVGFSASYLIIAVIILLSINSIFIGSSNEIGAFESGLAAKILGVVPSVIFGGTMTLIVVFIVWFFSPKLRKLSI